MLRNIVIENSKVVTGAVTSMGATIVGNLNILESSVSIFASFIGIVVGLLTIIKISVDLWERRKKRIRIAERREKLLEIKLNQDITRKGNANK